jgi:hypothetical protein
LEKILSWNSLVPSYEVNEVFVVFAVSWVEKTVLLKDVLTEDETEVAA